MNDFWGKHQLIDCGECYKDAIKDPLVIKHFINALVQAIDMVAYGEPILAHFATHDPSKGGYTFCQMIETSLIDGHLVDETGDAYLSVHSCKDFDEEAVLQIIRDYFAPARIHSETIYRQA